MFLFPSSTISQPVHSRRNEINRVSVHISSPFHFYLFIKLYSLAENQIALPATTLCLSFRVPPTEYKQGLPHRPLSTCFPYGCTSGLNDKTFRVSLESSKTMCITKRKHPLEECMSEICKACKNYPLRFELSGVDVLKQSCTTVH